MVFFILSFYLLSLSPPTQLSIQFSKPVLNSRLNEFKDSDRSTTPEDNSDFSTAQSDFDESVFDEGCFMSPSFQIPALITYADEKIDSETQAHPSLVDQLVVSSLPRSLETSKNSSSLSLTGKEGDSSLVIQANKEVSGNTFNNTILFASEMSYSAFLDYQDNMERFVSSYLQTHSYTSLSDCFIISFNSLSELICIDDSIPMAIKEFQKTLDEIMSLEYENLFDYLFNKLLNDSSCLSRKELFIFMFLATSKKKILHVQMNSKIAHYTLLSSKQNKTLFDDYYQIIGFLKSPEDIRLYHTDLLRIEKELELTSSLPFTFEKRLKEFSNFANLPSSVVRSIHFQFICQPHSCSPSDTFVLFLCYSHQIQNKLPFKVISSAEVCPPSTIYFQERDDINQLESLQKQLKTIYKVFLLSDFDFIELAFLFNDSLFDQIDDLFSNHSPPLLPEKRLELFLSVSLHPSFDLKQNCLLIHDRFLQNPFSINSQELFLLFCFYTCYSYFRPHFLTYEDYYKQLNEYNHLLVYSLTRGYIPYQLNSYFQICEKNLALISDKNFFSSFHRNRLLLQLRSDLFLISSQRQLRFSHLEFSVLRFFPLAQFPPMPPLPSCVLDYPYTTETFFQFHSQNLILHIHTYIQLIEHLLLSEKTSDCRNLLFEFLGQVEHQLFINDSLSNQKREELIDEIELLNLSSLETLCQDSLLDFRFNLEQFFTYFVCIFRLSQRESPYLFDRSKYSTSSATLPSFIKQLSSSTIINQLRCQLSV